MSSSWRERSDSLRASRSATSSRRRARSAWDSWSLRSASDSSPRSPRRASASSVWRAAASCSRASSRRRASWCCAVSCSRTRRRSWRFSRRISSSRSSDLRRLSVSMNSRFSWDAFSRAPRSAS
ncbi:MAG: hypothetical protein IPH09_07990 [bacterium]|nr:hypothetical protein [bacterium]